MKSQLAIELSENSVKFTTIQDGLIETIDSFFFKEKVFIDYKALCSQFYPENFQVILLRFLM